jgi:hypothetical protein
MVSSRLLHRVALVRTDVSEEPGASIRVTKIGELGTTQAATSNRRRLRRNTKKPQILDLLYGSSLFITCGAHQLCSPSVVSQHLMEPGNLLRHSKELCTCTYLVSDQ